MLCEADTLEFGAMWECPLLIELNTIPIHPGQQSKAAVKELADSFNNLRAFMDINNGDSAKSPQVVAANDPRDASQMVKFILNSNLVSCHTGFLNSNLRACPLLSCFYVWLQFFDEGNTLYIVYHPTISCKFGVWLNLPRCSMWLSSSIVWNCGRPAQNCHQAFKLWCSLLQVKPCMESEDLVVCMDVKFKVGEVRRWILEHLLCESQIVTNDLLVLLNPCWQSLIEAALCPSLPNHLSWQPQWRHMSMLSRCLLTCLCHVCRMLLMVRTT